MAEDGRGLSVKKLTIRQTWEQEPAGFNRELFVRPLPVNSRSVPVIIFFHGAGGMAKRSINGQARRFPHHLVVAPQGYRRTWNVHGEPSRAPDVDFFRKIVEKIHETYPKADMSNVTLIGYSNGAGLIHRLMIEVDDELFQTCVIQVASMVEQQYHNGNFWMPAKSTDDYGVKKKPRGGRRILYIHGTRDKVVPYAGGLRFRRFRHIPAEETALRWAQVQGYTGRPVSNTDGESIAGGIIRYRFKGTNVTFLKVVNGDHGLQPHRRHIDRLVDEFVTARDQGRTDSR